MVGDAKRVSEASRVAVAWVMKELGYGPRDILNTRKYARFVVQKVVFLLKFLGVKEFEGFDFSLYINGPYSSELADVYYSIAREFEKRGGWEGVVRLGEKYDDKVSERVKELVRFFGNKPHWWLEIAATILMIVGRYGDIVKDDEHLYRLVRSAKPWVTKDEFKLILNALRRKEIIK